MIADSYQLGVQCRWQQAAEELCVCREASGSTTAAADQIIVTNGIPIPDSHIKVGAA